MSARSTPTWAVVAISGAFALLFAYAVWTAVSYLAGWLSAAESAGLSLTPMGWVVWILAIILPLVLFGLAVGLGRRRGMGALTLMLLAGLALVAVYWLDVVAYTTVVLPVG